MESSLLFVKEFEMSIKGSFLERRKMLGGIMNFSDDGA